MKWWIPFTLGSLLALGAGPASALPETVVLDLTQTFTQNALSGFGSAGETVILVAWGPSPATYHLTLVVDDQHPTAPIPLSALPPGFQLTLADGVAPDWISLVWPSRSFLYFDHFPPVSPTPGMRIPGGAWPDPGFGARSLGAPDPRRRHSPSGYRDLHDHADCSGGAPAAESRVACARCR